jgi:AIPR protein
LQGLYRRSKNAISATITFNTRTVIPEVQGVQEAYLGLLPATEFLKLIVSDTGEIISSLFYDNVRHWQELNSVNTEINQTVSNDTTKVLFPLLNNGVTIVARRVQPTGNKFMVEDYQIVNGCQTSFVLYLNRERLDSSVMVPLRLIATQDETIKNAIIVD